MFGLHSIHSRKLFWIIFLLFMLLLVFVSFYELSLKSKISSPENITSTPDFENVIGESEAQLRNTVANAVKPTIISLDKDIVLTEALIISANKYITLTSDHPTNFFKLIGADEHDTIYVKNGGVLRLDGIILTHIDGDSGRGVTIEEGGTLIMVDGMIFGNSAFGIAGGVYNNGGKITMLGGEISNNYVRDSYNNNHGGGVYNVGNFTMFGGKIFNNTVNAMGGGVYNTGEFSMFDYSVIANNNAMFGGGVYNDYTGIFSMSCNSVIANNTASYGGGGISGYGVISMSGNSIVWGNVAESDGGGVCSLSGFSMSDNSVIANNTAVSRDGGGVYANVGFSMLGNSIICNNTAINGGGVHYSCSNSGKFSLSDNCIISNNTATYGGVFNIGNFDMSGNSIIANNVATQHGGGVYNRGQLMYPPGTVEPYIYYGNFTMWGGEISDNMASYGGGMYIGNYGVFDSQGGNVSGNTAATKGNIAV